ncbi:MAG: hypothetical protein ABFS35_11450 [Bacteroidota bacterium]
MAKVIIGIHGLGNKPYKELLEKWWKQSIIEGLNNICKDDIPDFKFKLVYWADILHEKPLDQTIKNPNNPLFLDEPYIQGIKKTNYIQHKKRRKVLDFIGKQLNKLFLNKDFSINYQEFADAILHRYFKDLEAYYKEKKTDNSGKPIYYKDIIRERLLQELKVHKNDKVLLISHSMGSIIAYDVLSMFNNDINIDTLVTMGSPLGFPVVKGKIAAELKNKNTDLSKLTTPQRVKSNWFNFSDIEDKVALDYRLADDFEKNKAGIKVIDFEVQNNYHVNENKNPHKSFGYLRTNEMAKVIFEFINGEKHVLKKRLRFKIFKFLIDIKIKTK